MDHFSSKDSAIIWGEWRRLPNGQWHREGQDGLGYWYEDNRDEDPGEPRRHRVPGQTPLMEEFAQDFGDLTVDASLDSWDLSPQEAITGQHFQGTSSSDNYSRSSRRGTGRYTENSEQFESNHRIQDRSKSSKSFKTDNKGYGTSSQRRAETKGKGKDIEQQKTLDPIKNQDEGTESVDYSPLIHMVGLSPTDIDVETQKRSTFGAAHDAVLSKQDFEGESYSSRVDPLLTISDSAHEKFSDTSASMSQLVASPRQHIIQQLITDVETILQNRTQSRNAVIRGHVTASGIQARGDAGSLRTGNEVTNANSGARQSLPQKKRKKLSPESDREDSDDEEQVQVEIQKGKHIEKVLFACPYVKHSRSRFGPKTCSSGRGWPNIARIKEHLYRRHRQATHCRRCQATFEDINALDAHQREPLPCKLSKGMTLEGFSEAQEKELKSRKNLSKMTEPEKWRKMYTILFPHVAEDQIPSPYYDPEDSQGSPTDISLAEFEAHVLRELPEQLANGFEEELNATGGKYNKSLLEKYTTKILNKVFNEYRWNARNMQRASVGSEVAVGDSSSQSDQQVEASSSVSATGMDSFNLPIAPSNTWWPQFPEASRDGPSSQSVSYPSLDLDQYDFNMECIAAGSDIQRDIGIDTHALGSEHESRENQHSQTWAWEEIDPNVDDCEDFSSS